MVSEKIRAILDINKKMGARKKESGSRFEGLVLAELDFDRVKHDYNRDGFVIIRGYLSVQELTDLKGRAVPLANRLLAEEVDKVVFRNLLKSLNKHDEWFNNQLREGRHVPLINHLMDGDAVGASAAWFDRPKGENMGVEPHVDAIGEYKTAGAGATIWFALDPVDAGNGCVHYLRGSQKNNYPYKTWVPSVDKESQDVFAAEMDPGDAVIHSANTVHWSGGNKTGQPRRAVTYFYLSRDAYTSYQKTGEKNE